MDIKNIKSQFPIFDEKINGKGLVYLDSANSSQKPRSVIDRISTFYEKEFSNVGRSVHTLAVKATNQFEETRDRVKNYINAQSREEIIFTKGATEAINLVATTFGEKFIKLSRDVHFLNDDRAKIKLEVNNHTGSKIKEIKEYTDYWYLYFLSKNFIKLWTKKVINK